MHPTPTKEKRIVGLIIFWSLMCNALILRKLVIFMCVPDLPGNKKKHNLYNAQHWYFQIFLKYHYKLCKKEQKHLTSSCAVMYRGMLVKTLVIY